MTNHILYPELLQHVKESLIWIKSFQVDPDMNFHQFVAKFDENKHLFNKKQIIDIKNSGWCEFLAGSDSLDNDKTNGVVYLKIKDDLLSLLP